MTYWALVVFVLVTPLPAQGHEACYGGSTWTYDWHTHTCLRVYRSGKRWTDARDFCAAQQLGTSYGVVTHLPKIDDSNTDDFIRHVMFPYSSWRGWIGLHKTDNGQFRWDGYPDEIPKYIAPSWQVSTRPYVCIILAGWRGEYATTKKQFTCQQQAKKIFGVTCQQERTASEVKFICTSAPSPIKAKCQWSYKYEWGFYENGAWVEDHSYESHTAHTGETSYTTTCSFNVSNLEPGKTTVKVAMYPDVAGTDLSENEKAQTEVWQDINVGEQNWACPTGWRLFVQAQPFECLWIGSNTADSRPDASDICEAFDAGLVSVFSDEKHIAVRSLLSQMNEDSTWTGLVHYSHGDFDWETVDGNKWMSYGTVDYDYYDYSNNECGIMEINTSLNSFSLSSCSGDTRAYICEKFAACKPGFYGYECENECHCHGQPCNTSSVNVTCPFGCQSGWRGPACNEQSQKAEVSYHCVDPIDGKKRLTISIDTKGTNYRAIEPIDEDHEALTWCNGTEISRSNVTDSVTISMSMEDEILAEIGQTCAGQVTGNQTLTWRIRLQEWSGIQMPLDVILEGQCDFSQAESLSRTGDPIITEEEPSIFESHFNPSKESVSVKLIDPATQGKVVSSTIGTPVVLQVQHDVDASTKVQSISPYNCVATSDDGTQQLRLLDSNGCQVEGSPVPPFAQTSQSNTLQTPSFPYFSFKGSASVIFRCSFVFCFDDNCSVGCHPNGLWPAKGRHVRSTRDDVTHHQAEDHVGVSRK